VSSLETPPTQAAPPPPDAVPTRECPRCHAPLRPDQEWCLNCGAGVGARVAAPRGWHWPVAVVSGLLALMLIAFALALVELAKDPEQVTTTQTPPAATPAPTPAPSGTADPSQIPPASGGTAQPPQVSDWPAGKTGYTVVLESATNRTAADARAKDLTGRGIPVGVLDTSGYAPVAAQRFVVFSGQFASRADARTALRGLRNQISGARVARIAPA
jgi:septal ring-binding cell division protein DamX